MSNKNNKIEITLLISNQAGVLSSLILNISSIGLTYRRQRTLKLSDETSRIVIYFDGEINCSKRESICTIEAHPGVIKVEKIVINNSDDS